MATPVPRLQLPFEARAFASSKFVLSPRLGPGRNMRAAEDEALDYSEEEPAPRTVQRGRGFRGSSKAVPHDDEDYSDNFEDDSMQESRATSQHSSRGPSRRGSGPPSQPLTARSEPRRHSQSHEGLQEPSVLQQLSAPQPMPPERRGGSCTGSERSLTPPPASPAPALAELGYRPGASRLSPDTGGRPPQVPQLPLRPVPELPTPVEQWRAPMEPQFDVPRPLPFPEVGKPLKHWDISAMAGPEPPSPQMSQADLPQRPTTQPPMGDLRPTDGRGGSRSIAPVGVEAELVEQLLHRFVLEHKAPTLQRRERAAYKEMLEQVSWTALEPKAAHDAALLLGKHFLAPVSANEALRAFRRCLHTILCDERVLDIVEHQMTLHFSRLKPKNTSEMVEN